MISISGHDALITIADVAHRYTTAVPTGFTSIIGAARIEY